MKLSQVIEELKAKANISRGALFRGVLKNGKMTTIRLTPEAIREIIKKRSQGIRGGQRSGVPDIRFVSDLRYR